MFTPNIDTSRYANQFTVSTNITMIAPTSVVLPSSFVNFHPQIVAPSFSPAFIISHNPISHNAIVNLNQSIQNLSPNLPASESLDKLTSSISVCVPVPIIDVCYNASTGPNGLKETISIGAGSVVKSAIEIPVTDQLKRDVNIVNEFPM